jgi:hypothetical protein
MIKLALRCLIFGAFLVSISSCRKFDTTLASDLTSYSDFYQKNRSADPYEASLIDFIQRNISDQELESIIIQIGYPYWNKSLKKRTNSSRAESGAETEIVCIPFVRDNEAFVNASLIINIIGTDTLFGFKCDWQYSQSNNSTNITPEQFATFFMVLDKRVFERTTFRIVDQSLFSHQDSTVSFIRLSQPSNENRTENYELFEFCEDVTVYVYVSCPYPNSLQCSDGCDMCIFCHDSYSYEYCWEELVWVGGSGGGGSGGTGGGGGGGGTPPDCPEGGLRAEQDPYPDPCEPGWVPYEDPPPHYNPCDKVSSLKTDDIFKEKVNDLKPRTSDDKEHAYFYGANGYVPPMFSGLPGGCEVKATINTQTPTLRSFIHVHNDACETPLFSPGDLAELSTMYWANINVFQHNLLDPKFSMVLVASSSTPNEKLTYALVIEDKTAWEAFTDKYFGGDDKTVDDLSLLYKRYRINRQNTDHDNEVNFLVFLRDLGAGVSVLKANSDLSEYSVLKVNRAGNQLITEPCN